jgi:hypothetical protein
MTARSIQAWRRACSGFGNCLLRHSPEAGINSRDEIGRTKTRQEAFAAQRDENDGQHPKGKRRRIGLKPAVVPRWTTPRIQTTSFIAPDALAGSQPWKEAVAPDAILRNRLGASRVRFAADAPLTRPARSRGQAITGATAGWVRFLSGSRYWTASLATTCRHI